eukprot:TRINITY_DN2087_c1_g1_i3.p1 TRINITY_DN2087_c1_g1~~TRINITY_DN2087_c1_g1_i3.p1  ORF type:complete len:421 (-),score=99.31 TRINITY_DN2087_c1_g1_i3:140-1402(-)
MSGFGRYEAPNLGQYFRKKLCSGMDVIGCEPYGYSPPRIDKATQCCVYNHESGTKVLAHAIDLVERVDRTDPPPARVVYVYPQAEVVSAVEEVAMRDPHEAFRLLWHHRALEPLGSRCSDLQSREWTASLSPGRPEAQEMWYKNVTPLDPAAIARRRTAHNAPKDPALQDTKFCIALFVLERDCRPTDDDALLELRDPGAPVLEAAPNVRIVEAARRRDFAEVRSLLEGRCHPDAADSRGWTALHAACAVRPCTEVLDLLLPVSNVCARTLDGRIPCDIAFDCGHDALVTQLQARMREHPDGKHLPHASTVTEDGGEASLQASAHGKRVQDEEEHMELLGRFASMLFGSNKYKSAEAAFRSFDVNGNGTLSASEFHQSAKALCFAGDITAVFKALDYDRQGDISLEEFQVLKKFHDVNYL